ncbi:MAG: hypothetical protein GY780_04915 [bacterium]|nr:hypothetical protein [bacterium]
MKFVHLTPQKNISRVVKNGIRMGDGLLGKGVYLTPLVLLPYLGENGEVTKVSVPISTSREWKNWARARSCSLGGKPERVAAIVIDLPKRFYPVQMRVISLGEGYLKTVEAIWELVESKGSGVSLLDPKDRKLFIEYLDNPIGNLGFNLKVEQSGPLGNLINTFSKSGGVLWGCDLQVLVSEHLPSSCIKKVVPLYRTNKENSARRKAGR